MWVSSLNLYDIIRLKPANFNAQQEEHFVLDTHNTSNEENSGLTSLLEDDRSMPGPSRNLFSSLNEFTPRYKNNLLDLMIIV